jgi:hypothetical protein
MLGFIRVMSTSIESPGNKVIDEGSISVPPFSTTKINSAGEGNNHLIYSNKFNEIASG